MANPAKSLWLAIVGDKDNETIKAGTLAVTRGTGVIAVGMNGLFGVLDAAGSGPWNGWTSQQKLCSFWAPG